MNKISAIDTQQVKHIAHLARLSLSGPECEEFSQQLTSIIGYFNCLQEVDVQGVAPANQLQALRAALRPDIAVTSPVREEFLSGAPRREGGYIQVPPIYPTASGEVDQGREE
jgi:aspartyl-tRNA(Asn)/glutamyl-tRNA(Gln) amidotransferase subunit C